MVIGLEVLIFVTALGAGVFGALIGVGGGLIMVPLLAVFLGVEIHVAIAASLLGVIAVSTVASTTYLDRGLADRRLGLVLLVSTALGGVIGGYVAGLLDGRVLTGMFGVLMVWVAAQMVRGHGRPVPELVDVPGRLEFDSAYTEPTSGKVVPYRARRVGLGALISIGAGALSGLLGIGGGVVNVPTLNVLMGIPIRVATATSTYMLGATAAASSVLYYSRGQIDPLLAAPVVLGVFVGARLGALLATRVAQRTLQLGFAAVALLFALQMLWKAWAGA
jgi:hypothetical protein